MRPSTAKGGAGVAGPGMRPGTASAPSAAMGRPGSGRMGTARIGTAGMQHAAMVGATSMGAALNIADRPVTQQGLMAMRQATAGPGRQVQDSSYFVGVLRSRVTDINGEVTRMKSELDKGVKDVGLSAALERKYETLIKEVRNLEGDLADVNLAMDKSRTSMDPSEILAYHSNLRRRNEAVRREVDALFMERQEREKGAHRLEEAIAELTRAAEARINSLPPPLIAEYNSLMEENNSLNAAGSELQGALEEMNMEIERAEAELRRDRVRDEYAMLEKRAAVLERERESLEEEMKVTRLDPAKARSALMEKVKRDNARVQEIDKRIRALEEECAARKKAIAGAESEIEERKNEAGDSAKYEMLFKRDQEMTEFIDRFPEMREKELSEQRRVQDTIVQLLEHISEGMAREGNMPSRAQAEEMKEDLSDKQRELKASEMTADRLQDELQLRQTELEKINTLDEKIGVELTSLADRMRGMKEELSMFADIDAMRAKAEAAKRELDAKVKKYNSRRDGVRQQVAPLAAEVERKRNALSRHPQATALDNLEGKLKQYEQVVFGLKEFIATKGREADYESARNEVMKAASELNVLIQKAAVQTF